MSGMFRIALELGNPNVGVITPLSLLFKMLTAFKKNAVADSGNTSYSMGVLSRKLKFRKIYFEVDLRIVVSNEWGTSARVFL